MLSFNIYYSFIHRCINKEHHYVDGFYDTSKGIDGDEKKGISFD